MSFWEVVKMSRINLFYVDKTGLSNRSYSNAVHPMDLTSKMKLHMTSLIFEVVHVVY
jgi:hypothetical protein